METGVIFLFGLITALSFMLLLVTSLSYRKYKNKKLLFIFLVILVLFIRGLFLSLGLFYDNIAQWTSSGYIWGVDVIVLVLLYV